MAAQTALSVDLAFAVTDLCGTYLRLPTEVIGYPGATRTLVFVPELTTAEQATYDRLVRAASSHVPGITPAEWITLEPKLTEIRAFRTRTLAQWNALAATTREADEIAYLNDITDVLRALLRD